MENEPDGEPATMSEYSMFWVQRMIDYELVFFFNDTAETY